MPAGIRPVPATAEEQERDNAKPQEPELPSPLEANRRARRGAGAAGLLPRDPATPPPGNQGGDATGGGKRTRVDDVLPDEAQRVVTQGAGFPLSAT